MIYFNNAATSWPKAPAVAAAAAKAIEAPPGAAKRGGLEDFDVFGAVRKALCPLLGLEGAQDGRIALGPNASWALNLAIFGMELKKGDTVLTSCAEHNSVLRPLYALEKERGVRVIHVETDERGRIRADAWREAAERYAPRLAVFTHASNVTGAVNDAKRLAAAAKAAGAAVLLDASQSLGVTDVRAADWNLDMLAFTGHKYLLGPQGTGGLYVREGFSLKPHLLGGTGAHSDLDTMPEAMPLRLEAGTGNEPGFFGLLAALQWTKENPPDIAALERRMARLREGLREAGARVIAPENPATPVLSFTLDGLSTEEAGFMLNESCAIVCRTGLHCAPRIFPCLGIPSSIRFSLSRFSTDAEVEAAIEAVRDIQF